MPRILDTKGTGQIHPQNARANSRISTTTTTKEMSTRGTAILEATKVSSEPNGHRSEISIQPKAEMVPMPKAVT